MEERGEHLTIFDLNHEKAPTLAQITLQLTEKKDNNPDDTSKTVDWIAAGIKAQNDQSVISFISFGSHQVSNGYLLDQGFD